MSSLTNLFGIEGIEPPAGDLGIKPGVVATRAVWTTPLDDEAGAPRRRIIHVRALQLYAPATLTRLGIRRAPGYHKCGSHVEVDWVVRFRVLIWDGAAWVVQRYERSLPRPQSDTVQWFDLGGVETSSAVVEIRECGIDPWWPSWNLATGAILLEGTPPSGKSPRGERASRVRELALRDLPPGITAHHANGEVRFTTRFLAAGFCLARPGLSFFSVDDEGDGRVTANLLRLSPGMTFQGPFLHPVGSGPLMAPMIRFAVTGHTDVRGNTVHYTIAAPDHGLEYSLLFTVFEERIRLDVRRTGTEDFHAWLSAAWSIGFDARVSATTALGTITRVGESGVMALPVLLHAPGFGSVEITPVEGDALWRSDAFRTADLAIHQLKVGEVPTPDGDYILRRGTHHAVVDMIVRDHPVRLKPGTPVTIQRALRRNTLTALSYRPDTGTLSNNGNSMHCPICMDNWAAVAIRAGKVLPHLGAMDLLGDSIERWLDGGPGYASGGMAYRGEIHAAEDEYIMTGTAALLGTALYLEHAGTPAWTTSYRSALARELRLMRQRDVDNDGLVESRFRLGISGQYQWSTCWYDVISFGWKCAWSNALLYPALTTMAAVLPRLGAPDLAEGLASWAARLRRNFLPTFFNEATGWLAGWRCRENRLHDHAFIAVNGAAVTCGLIDPPLARTIMERLWREGERVGMPDPLLGIPTSLWPIPDDDLAEIMHGFPFGYYANGGLSLSQSRHLAGALYQVGMTREADTLLERLCAGIAAGTAFGGAKSGVDARTWDGRPCGYEGLLTDQFGILALALEKYSTPDEVIRREI